MPFVDKPRAEIEGASALVLSIALRRKDSTGQTVRDAVKAYVMPDQLRERVLEDLDAIERAGRAYVDAGGLLVSGADSGTPALPQDQGPSASLTMTVNETAAALGLGPRRVRDMCRDRVLQARRHGRSWVIDTASVDIQRAAREDERRTREAA